MRVGTLEKLVEAEEKKQFEQKGYTYKKTCRVLDRAAAGAKELLQISEIWTVKQLSLYTGNSTSTIRKYFSEIAQRAGAEVYKLDCVEYMFPGSDYRCESCKRRRKITIAARLGTDLDVIYQRLMEQNPNCEVQGSLKIG